MFFPFLRLTTVNQEDIQKCIPHRDPFLWLDRVSAISDTAITAHKDLAASLPVFSGHYPDFPVFPGVLQCEACFQAGAVLISRLISTGNHEVPVVTRLNNVQFRRMIRPGQTIDIQVNLSERLANAFFLTGRVSVDGKVSARLEFVCTAAAVDA